MIKQKWSRFREDLASIGFVSSCVKRLAWRFPSGPGAQMLAQIDRFRMARDLKKAEAEGVVPWTAAEFLAIENKYKPFLKYYRNRWPYLEAAATMAMKDKPNKILEVGAYLLPLFKSSDVIDLKTDIPRLTFRHDITKIPWPIKDKAYDTVIALQVWEHLGNAQADAFREVMRVARSAVLSFPYLWDMPNDPSHHGIDKAIIARWTLHHPPEEVVEVFPRIIYRFRF